MVVVLVIRTSGGAHLEQEVSGVVIISLPTGFAATTTGTVTVTTNGTNTVYTFTGSGTLVPVIGFSANYLVVAGGGSGGAGIGAGGGAGGFLTGTTSLTTGTTYTITVGNGGSAVTDSSGLGVAGNSGNNSLISGSGFTTITAIAGGGGGAYS